MVLMSTSDAVEVMTVGELRELLDTLPRHSRIGMAGESSIAGVLLSTAVMIDSGIPGIPVTVLSTCLEPE